MKFLSKIVSYLLLILAFPHFTSAIEAPHEIAGIKLGSDVLAYPDFENSNYLKEVVVVDWHGFRKGIISYGICESPNTIVKIRMKYEDSSKKFFNTLMTRFKKKFGVPTEWNGDSFGINHIWKWKFKDSEGKSVNLILQHNLGDQNQNMGNMVKLSYPELDELERLCFNRKCEEVENLEEKMRKERLKETSWDFLIPK